MAPPSGITIPSEVITEILYRLPSKSIGRFRSVSKGWLSQLTDPQFIKTHKDTINRNHLIFTSYNNDEDLSLNSHPLDHHESILTPTKLHLNFSFYRDLSAVEFLGTCDGLVLARVLFRYSDSSLVYIYDSSHGGNSLVIFNPTTWEFVDYLCGMSRIYTRSNLDTHFMYGFGYDSVTDDYKVVIISYKHITRSYFNYNYLSVYSLRNKTWTRVLVDCPHTYNKFPGVCANGFIHWVVKKKDTDNSHIIVAFSLADECFTQLPSPNFGNDLDIMSKMGCRPAVLGGKLAIYLGSEVWLMNEYGVKESWTKIPLDKEGAGVQMVETMIFGDDGKIWVANDKDGRMLMYDVEMGNSSKTVYVWDSKNFMLNGTFVESLVSPKFSITK